jgi:hypothetical protein
MPAVAIPVYDVTREGVEPTDVAVGTADMYLPDNDGLVVVLATNEGGSSHEVVATPTVTIGGMAMAEITISVPAGESRWIGPWPPAVFNADDGSVSFACSSDELVLYAVRI